MLGIFKESSCPHYLIPFRTFSAEVMLVSHSFIFYLLGIIVIIFMLYELMSNSVVV